MPGQSKDGRTSDARAYVRRDSITSTQRHGDHRKVRREHGAPSEPLRELTGDQRPDRRGQPHARAEQSEDARPPVGRGLIPQDRHRRRNGGRAAGRHQDARRAKGVRVAAEEAERAAGGDDGQSDDDRAAMADEIAELAARDSAARCSRSGSSSRATASASRPPRRCRVRSRAARRRSSCCRAAPRRPRATCR